MEVLDSRYPMYGVIEVSFEVSLVEHLYGESSDVDPNDSEGVAVLWVVGTRYQLPGNFLMVLYKVAENERK